MRADLLPEVDSAGVKTFSVPIQLGTVVLFTIDPQTGELTPQYRWETGEGVLFQRGENVGLVEGVPVVTSAPLMGLHAADWTTQPNEENWLKLGWRSKIYIEATGETFDVLTVLRDSALGVMCQLSRRTPDAVLEGA